MSRFFLSLTPPKAVTSYVDDPLSRIYLDTLSSFDPYPPLRNLKMYLEKHAFRQERFLFPELSNVGWDREFGNRTLQWITI